MVIKDEYKDYEKYIHTTTNGLYNNYFIDLSKKIMNRYPLEFGFEGSFYRAFFVRKKNYVGYKVGAITCEIGRDGKLKILE